MREHHISTPYTSYAEHNFLSKLLQKAKQMLLFIVPMFFIRIFPRVFPAFLVWFRLFRFLILLLLRFIFFLRGFVSLLRILLPSAARALLRILLRHLLRLFRVALGVGLVLLCNGVLDCVVSVARQLSFSPLPPLPGTEGLSSALTRPVPRSSLVILPGKVLNQRPRTDGDTYEFGSTNNPFAISST